MSNDTIAPRIELLQEQIENLVNSGYFTEIEMDKLSFPLREELALLKRQLYVTNLNETAQKFGTTPEQIVEGRRIFSNLWGKIDEVINPIFNIEVVDAEILTPNTING